MWYKRCMSEFSEAFEKRIISFAQDFPERKATTEFQKELERISGDFSGSPLEEFLCEEDVESCRDFLRLAERKDFPNASIISMQHRRFGGVALRHAWSKPKNFSNAPFRRFDHRTVWKGIGYSIGSVALGIGRCNLMLSPFRKGAGRMVGELRCDRDPQSFASSYGMGYGRLPEMPEEDLPVVLPKLVDTLYKFLPKDI